MSPTAPSRLTVDVPLDKDEGISDEEDPAELRVLLDLTEQEATQLRRKVEELEALREASKKQVKELQDKCKSSSPGLLKTAGIVANGNADKIKLKDKEIIELKMKLNEKDRAIEKMKLDQRRSSGGGAMLDVDHKRQVEMVEQEAAVLRGKVAKLEQEIDGISMENKKLTVQVARLARKDASGGVDKNGTAELTRVKESLSKLEKENGELQSKLTNILEVDTQKLPARTPKRFTDMTTKMQLQKMIGELEDEVKEVRAILTRSGAQDSKRLQEELDVTNAEIGESIHFGLSLSNKSLIFCAFH